MFRNKIKICQDINATNLEKQSCIFVMTIQCFLWEKMFLLKYMQILYDCNYFILKTYLYFQLEYYVPINCQLSLNENIADLF